MNDALPDKTMNDSPALIRWIKAHDLAAYFVLTFLITFGGWFIALLTGVGTVFDLGLWGPALAAILITAATLGRQGLKELLGRLLHGRVPVRWYLIILLGWPAISILAALLHAQVTNQPLRIHWGQWSGFLTYLSSALVLGFWACEEIGWRGFALPRLMNRWNALLSSVILGTVWWGWHLPYFLGSDGISPDFYPFLVLTVSVSILMTWVFKHTQGSLFLATVFHFWMNVYDSLQADKLPLNEPGGETTIKYGLLAGAAILVVALYGYRNLAKDRPRSRPVELKTSGA